MSKHLDSVLRRAVDQGLLAGAQTEMDNQHRPWPVLVMTAIAAWFAAIPFGLVVGLTFLSGQHTHFISLVLSVIFLGGAVTLLRKAKLPLFLEQMAIPGLIIGVALFIYGLSAIGDARHDMGLPMAIATPLPFVLACLLPQAWLRVLLGAAGAGLAALALAGAPVLTGDAGLLNISTPLAWECVLVVWLLGQWVLSSLERKPRRAASAATLEALLSGMAAMALLALAYYSGDAFLLSASLPDGFDDRSGGQFHGTFDRMVSLVFAIGAAGWMTQRWPGLRRLWFSALGATAVFLCWFAPSMGAALLVLAVCVTSGRRNLALLAGVAALWMVGALYYYLYWPLADKALLLLGCGLVFGAIARFAMPGALLPATAPEVHPEVHPAARTDSRWKRGLLAGAGVLALVAVNTAIWQKETLISTGQPVFVELAPVDPRSLMQGDYMALNFAIPFSLGIRDMTRARLVAQRAPSGVLTLLRVDDGRPLGPQELLIETISKHGRPMIVTDAWYFKEGEAKRWEGARYGEFRVDANGKALLVGLRGPKLEKL